MHLRNGCLISNFGESVRPAGPVQREYGAAIAHMMRRVDEPNIM